MIVPDSELLAVHAAVDRLVLTHDAYEPVELLLERGALDYERYEDWRRGRTTSLEEAVSAKRGELLALLGAAADWAGKLGLTPAPVRYEGWGQRRGSLTVSPNPEVERLVAVRYERVETSGQLDLFLDAGDVVRLRDLRAALIGRRSVQSAKCLEELRRRHPVHGLAWAAERLHQALHQLETGNRPDRTPQQELRALRDELEPAARLFLGAGGARDFLAPFWRGLARRVEGTPFDRTRPDLHASFAVAQCLDWRGVTRSVVATAGYADEPVLLARLAEAELRCGERVRAIEHLMRLCWLAADAAAEHLDAGSLGDGVLLAAWQSFQDLDPEIAIDAAWFPATLLLDEPGLARVCAPVAPEPPAAPVRAYATLAALFSTRGEAPNEAREIQLRRELKDAHPGILALYLHRREAARRR